MIISVIQRLDFYLSFYSFYRMLKIVPYLVLLVTYFVTNTFMFILYRYCFAPFGKSLGIKNTRSKKAPPNEILEKAYSSKKIKHKQVDIFYRNRILKKLNNIFILIINCIF